MSAALELLAKGKGSSWGMHKPEGKEVSQREPGVQGNTEDVCREGMVSNAHHHAPSPTLSSFWGQ